MQILVIEDEARIQAFLTRGLEAEGYAVVAADNGRDGLALALAGRWDLVVLDLLLPGLSGLQLLQELHQARPQLPVLILSARADLRTKLRGFELGATDYVSKPFSLDELLARVRVHVRGQHAGRGRAPRCGRQRRARPRAQAGARSASSSRISPTASSASSTICCSTRAR